MIERMNGRMVSRLTITTFGFTSWKMKSITGDEYEA
jgi:hypothetical protein